MSDMKCPVCGEKIEHIRDGWCNCNNRCIGSGSLSLWQALIDSMKEHDLCHDALVERTKELDRTRKALDVIKKEISKETMPDFAVIHNALKGVGDE